MQSDSHCSRAPKLDSAQERRKPYAALLQLGGALVLSVGWAVPALAETITIACEANPMFGSDAMTLVYKGDAAGTLTITGPFGTMALPATKEDRQGTDEAGNAISATGIRAAGPASIRMPDKAAIEACVKGKLPADQLADSDIVFMTTIGCAGEAPITTEPVAINASAEVAFVPEVFVGVTRTYTEPTDLATGTIALETYPTCAVSE